jgi:5-methylcytosine-specific restriction endonuclease McrA
MTKRRAVFGRAGGICERCGERTAEEVHHLSGVKDNRLESLLAVCKSCHLALEAEKRR